MARWRYLRSSFWLWFGLIWAFVGGAFAVIATGMLIQGDGVPEAGQGTSPPWMPLPFLGGGLLFGGIGLALVLRTLKACQRHLLLLREGLAAIGTVTAVEENLNVRINRRHPLHLRYEFKDAIGQSHSARSPFLPRELEDRYAPGDSVIVLYDPDDPAQHTLDLYGERAGAGVAVEAR